jgi:hypothetical protein
MQPKREIAGEGEVRKQPKKAPARGIMRALVQRKREGQRDGNGPGVARVSCCGVPISDNGGSRAGRAPPTNVRVERASVFWGVSLLSQGAAWDRRARQRHAKARTRTFSCKKKIKSLPPAETQSRPTDRETGSVPFGWRCRRNRALF